MVVLALDYGSARCGVAVCDPTQTIVTPLGPVAAPGTRRGMRALVELIGEREAGAVVVGLPLTLRGGDSAQTLEAREFAARLAARLGEDVPVELYDERLTTRLAQRDPDPRTSEDSRAAAHLLEGWLTARQPPAG